MVEPKPPRGIKSPAPRILYLLPTLNLGGAEVGLVTLLDQGLFADMDLTVAAIFRGDGIILPELKHRGVHPVILSDCARGSMRELLKSMVSFRSLLNDLAPDVLIMSLPLSNIVGRLVCPFRHGPRLISFEHNSTYDHGLYKPILTLLSWRIDGVMADCEATLRITKRFFLLARQTKKWIVPLLALAETAPVKSDYNVPSIVRILSVGRLVKQKNYSGALGALALLKKKGIDFRYTIVGGGPLEQNLRRQVAALALADHVTFAGECREWRDLALSADIFFMTSVYEGLSMATIEAMSFGLPVVATDVGGVQDYGRDGVNMVKVQGHDAQSLAKKLMELLSDHGLRARVGRQAVLDSRDRFGSEAARAQIYRIRDDLLGFK